MYGDLAGKITGCLLDGVQEFDKLVKDADFLHAQVSQVYKLLDAQNTMANSQQPMPPQANMNAGNMPMPPQQM